MWKHFKISEFDCKHCGENKMDPKFIDILDAIREEVGFGLVVTSGYRCPTHNQNVSSTGPNGPHTTGKAVDFGVQGDRAYAVVKAGVSRGLRVGVNQKGNARFIHLDNINGSPIWSY